MNKTYKNWHSVPVLAGRMEGEIQERARRYVS